MLDIESAEERLLPDSEKASSWCDRQYDVLFASYFSESRELFERLNSVSHPITNDELQWILIELPIRLFRVAEQLSSFRVSYEVAKIALHQREAEVMSDEQTIHMKSAERKEYAQYMTSGDRLLIMLHASIIERVEREISFSRELIMSAKKVWDSRFKTDTVNPVSEPDEDLPTYSSKKPKSYIKG